MPKGERHEWHRSNHHQPKPASMHLGRLLPKERAEELGRQREGIKCACGRAATRMAHVKRVLVGWCSRCPMPAGAVVRKKFEEEY